MIFGIKLMASYPYTGHFALCSGPYKWWVRHIITTTSTTATIKTHKNHPFPTSLVLHSKLGWRITPCAHISLVAHDKVFTAYVSNSTTTNNNTNKNNKRQLGFDSCKCCFSFSTSSGFSSANSGDSSNSSPSPSSSGSGLPADMGSDYNSQPPSPSLQHYQNSSSKLLTLPTILTLGRVAAVPLIISTFYVDSWWGRTATTSIFIAAAITDWLDGYLARKMRLGSVFGAFLDPVADKLMVATTLVLLCTRPLDIPMFGQVPWLLTVPAVAIIGREITMSAVREWAASQNTKLLEAVAVNNLGKWKTATQMIALTILLATRENSLGNPGILVVSGVALLYASAGLSLWSLAVYMGKVSKVLLK